MKLIADVGLVGVPNCGKSTLLSRITNATPKIASYAFTTKVPNIGVCDVGRSEEHTSELQSLMRISYAVFCLKKKNISATTKPQHTLPTRNINRTLKTDQ